MQLGFNHGVVSWSVRNLSGASTGGAAAAAAAERQQRRQRLGEALHASGARTCHQHLFAASIMRADGPKTQRARQGKLFSSVQYVHRALSIRKQPMVCSASR